MSDTDKDQEKGDEVLRRLLKIPPDPKTGKEKPAKETAMKRRIASLMLAFLGVSA